MRAHQAHDRLQVIVCMQVMVLVDVGCFEPGLETLLQH